MLRVYGSAAPPAPRRGPVKRVAASLATAVGSHLFLGIVAVPFRVMVLMFLVRALVNPDRREGAERPSLLEASSIFLFVPALFGAVLVLLKAAMFLTHAPSLVR